MHPHHNYHYFLHFFYEHKAMTELYLVIGLRSLAISMIALFLPMYFFLLRNSFEDVLIFYFAFFLAAGICFPIASFIASKVGNVHMDLISAPLGILFYMLIYFSNPLAIGIFVLGLLYGAFEAFFWVFFHGEFSYISDKKMLSKQVSGWRAVSFLFTLMGPVLGGAIISFYGFHTLFLTVALVLIASPIPLLFSKDIKIAPRFSPKEIFSKKHLKMAPAFIGYGAAGVATTITWPLFIYFIVPDFLEIGTLSLIINLVSVIVVLFIGSKVVKYGKIRLIRIGGLLFSISILLRAFVVTSGQVLFAWSFGALTFPIVAIPTESLTYSRSKKENMAELFTFREWMLNVGRFIMLAVIFWMALVFPLEQALTYSFILGGSISTLISTLK